MHQSQDATQPCIEWLIPLGIVLVTLAWVGEPGIALTGVSLIAVGATASLAKRPRAEPFTLTAQAAIYAGLYVIFAGAVWDLADDSTRPTVLAHIAVSLAVAAIGAGAWLLRVRR